MKVVHISTYDVSGGAARAAYRLHSGLQRAEVHSSMFVRKKKSGDRSIRAYNLPRDLRSKARRWLRRRRIRRSREPYRANRPPGLGIFSDDRTQHGARVLQQMPQADLINLHWIRRFLDLEAFFTRVSVPVVWTLHDMNAFTGGCHYDEGCGKYEARCGACPQLGSTDEKDLSRQIWKRKRAAYRQIATERLHIVTPSQWLKKEVQRSSLLGRFPVSAIPNSLDTEAFAPRNREAARQVLGVPQGGVVLLFVAQSVANRRKGFALLVEALEALQFEHEGLYLVSVGSRRPDMATSLPQQHLGSVANNRLLSLIYSAADTFVIPSLQENLPNTVLEAMACGTPVVGFDTGGIPDMVRPDETGWLAPVGDVRALRDAIAQALSDDEKRRVMGRQCRAVVLEEYALEVQAQRYVRLYEKMLAGHL